MKKIATLFLTLAAAYSFSVAQHSETTLREGKSKYYLKSIISSDNEEDFYFHYDKENRFCARDRFSNNRREATDSLFYDEKGNIVRMDRWARFGTTAVDPAFEVRFKYQYDQEGRIVKRHHYMKPDFQNPISVRTYYYREDGKLDYYNDVSAFIGVDTKTVHTYDDKGLLAKSSLQDKQGDGSYREVAFTEFFYEMGKTLPKELVYQVFDPQGKKFIILKKDWYTYIDNSTESYIAVNGERNKVYRIDYKLNNTDEHREIVAPLTPEDDDTFYRYGFDHKRLSEKYSRYQGSETTVYVRDKVYAYEQKTIGVEMPETVKTEVTVYPNPATEQISIEGTDIEQIALFDAKGMLVRNISVEADFVNMEVASLARGTYVLQVKSASGLQSYPVVLR